MLRSFTLVFLLICLWSCSEQSQHAEQDASTSETTSEDTKSTTLEEFSEHFSPVSEMPSLDLQGGMGMSLVLDMNSYIHENDEHTFLPVSLVHDWIIPFLEATPSNIDESSWEALFFNQTETNAVYCISYFKEEDVKFYLLRISHEAMDKSELIHLGSISMIKYKDNSEEPGEKHDFDITDCENLVLEIRGDSLFTQCIRYSATVGKDWRIDQNLYVNDTVKLPIIESSYSLY